jgi:hypothetical protein
MFFEGGGAGAKKGGASPSNPFQSHLDIPNLLRKFTFEATGA